MTETQQRDLSRYINICEAGFVGTIFWKSAGGAFSDVAQALSEIQGKDNPQAITIGLAKFKEPDSDYCCDKRGYITGILLLVGDKYGPDRITEESWEKANSFEDEGPGLHVVQQNSLWLVNFS